MMMNKTDYIDIASRINLKIFLPKLLKLFFKVMSNEKQSAWLMDLKFQIVVIDSSN